MWFADKENEPIDDEIRSVLEEMAAVKASDDKYETMVKNLETLCRAKSHARETKLDPNTILAVGANVVGIAMILSFEKVNVLGSKALGFVFRGK